VVTAGQASFRRILVVDDEPAVLEYLKRALVANGYEVTAATSVEEALEILDDGLDLIITDVNLGSEKCFDIAEAAAQRHPAPQVIAISGNADGADGLALGRAGVSAFLSKPFRSDELLELIEGLQAPRHLELDAVVRRVVGDWPMPDVIASVRRSMVFEALARTHGNKAKAAALLGISRQNLQNILSRGSV
jgi:DNA-binding NtrC family response regulator